MGRESQYRTAKAIEDAGGQPTCHPVCFHAGAFSLGRRRRSMGEAERVIRFTLHEGRAIDVAMSYDLAAKLGAALVGGGPQPFLNE